MAYNEYLADRIRLSLKKFRTPFLEKLMFGGVCFMVDDKMCMGIVKENMMVRIDPELQDNFLQEKGCRIMDFTHRPMKGYLYVLPEAIDSEPELDKWVQRCLDFNPKAGSAKKKKAAKKI